MDLRLLRYFIAVAEELHFGRAAARLHMSQPPLSRAVRQLEADLGVLLLRRSSAGVALTPAGTALLGEAQALLDQAGRARTRVMATAGARTLTVGTLVDSAEQVGTSLAAAFRRRQPDADVRVREFDLCEPDAGLRADLVDVAVTRTPFDLAGLSTRVLGTDPVGVVLTAADALAGRGAVVLADLDGREWFTFPEGTDPAWCAYWNPLAPSSARRSGPRVRTVQECFAAVRWHGSLGLSPTTQDLPPGLVWVLVEDIAPSPLVLAWRTRTANPLIASFVALAVAGYQHDHPAPR